MTDTPKLYAEELQLVRIRLQLGEPLGTNGRAVMMIVLDEHAALTARVAELERELATWKQLAEYSCEQPAPGCDCAGCSLAREDNEDP